MYVDFTPGVKSISYYMHGMISDFIDRHFVIRRALDNE